MRKAILLGILGLCIGYVLSYAVFILLFPLAPKQIAGSVETITNGIAMAMGIIFFVGGYRHYSGEKTTGTANVQEQSPSTGEMDKITSPEGEKRKMRIAAGQCPKCGSQVNPTDRICRSCKTNLAYAREHLNEW
jgi:hypothetical protein